MQKTRLITLFLILACIHCSAQQAKWITASQNQDATNTWMCFRKVVNLEKQPITLIARLATDSKYWLWINGELVIFEGGVKRGPTPYDTYSDSFDIAPYLKNENNLIAILVWYFGKGGFSHNSSGKAALFFEAIDEESGIKILSDKNWKAAIYPAYRLAGEPFPNFRLPESSIQFDARKEWVGWNQSQNHTSILNRDAVELGIEGSKPWNKLYDRIIPQWKNYGLKSYSDTTYKLGNLNDTLICSLPYNAQITPYLKIEARDGQLITIHTDNLKGGSEVNVKAEYITRSGIQEYESYGWMNGHAVYYIFPKGLKILDVKYRETSYNTDFTGKFECNDAFLNKKWEKARRTLLLTMRDTYMDCPDRERAQWWGDAVNELGEAFYALSPSSHLLAKKGMYELIRWQKPGGALFSPIPASNWDKELPCQMLASVGYFGFWTYYLHTGDLKTIRDLYNGVKNYLSLTEYEPDGTVKLRTGDWNWGDWGVNIDNTAIYNVWYYLALKGVANMAKELQYSDDFSFFKSRMSELELAFNKKFWQGEYYITPNFNGKPDDRVQALAVVAGLADQSKYEALTHIFKTSEFASPYMEKYVLEALFLMQNGTYALQRMRKRFDEMVNDSVRTTLYEGWGIGAKGFGGGTINHAWSGGGLTILSQYLCGISPIDPGYTKFRIAPQPAGLSFAKSTVHSVAGLIKSNFIDNPGTFILEVTIPAGTKALIQLPFRTKQISINNKRHQYSEDILLNEGKYILEQKKTQ